LPGRNLWMTPSNLTMGLRIPNDRTHNKLVNRPGQISFLPDLLLHMTRLEGWTGHF